MRESKKKSSVPPPKLLSTYARPAGLIEVKELSNRISEASKVMRIAEGDIMAHLFNLGIGLDESGLKILDSIHKMNDASSVDEGALHEFTTQTLVTNFFGQGESATIEICKSLPFKVGWSILKGPWVPVIVDPFGVLPNKPVEQWGDKELIEKYGPYCDSNIANELTRRSKDRPFIVFNSEETVDVELSLNIMRQTRRCEIGNTYMVNPGTPQARLIRIFRVGEFPLMSIEECPIHAGTALADGFCEKCQNSWKGIEDTARVIVRIAYKDSAYVDKATIHTLICRLNQEGSQFLLDTPAARHDYEELTAQGRLPRLKLQLSKDVKNCDPFYRQCQF